jgi:UDP-N-acetyl-D-mannosaminuronic acid dehydrogenase
MPLSFRTADDFAWKVEKIAVIGPGIVGMPMAAMLAHARIREGTDRPARVTVVQRDSPTSGWKVNAINEGRSPIGGIEPDLDRIVAEGVAAGLLNATHDVGTVADADVILICVQTDKKGFGPDYGPLMDSLEGVAAALRRKPAGNVPLVIFESTLAPSSMSTVIRSHFADRGLVEGRDLLLGNSPNRVMPGRLVERVAGSDKIVAGLHPLTPRLVKRLYERIVTGGTLHETNSMTAEVVKTLENAYRDVRIAYSAEIARFCDEQDFDFYAVRDAANARLAQSDGASADPNAVPSGGLLVPTVGVGGHCLPKDGILLWWRAIQSGVDTSHSLILAAREVNDESPRETIALAERHFGPLAGKVVAVMGAAYRFNSEDTRNSPSLVLARLLIDRGCTVTVHDPFVKPDDQNLLKFGLQAHFTNDLGAALASASCAFFCTGHREYFENARKILALAPALDGVVDACNLFRRQDFVGRDVGYTGIGRGGQRAPEAFVDFVVAGFKAVELGVANEVQELVDFLNARYADGPFNEVKFEDVRRIAGTCVTGCRIERPRPAGPPVDWFSFESRLAGVATGAGVDGVTTATSSTEPACD